MQCGPIWSFTVYVLGSNLTIHCPFFFFVASLMTTHLLSLYYLVSPFPPFTDVLFSLSFFYLLFIPLPFLSSTKSTLAHSAAYCSYPAGNLVAVWPFLHYKWVLPFSIFVQALFIFAAHSLTAPHCRWESLTILRIIFLSSHPLICFVFLFKLFPHSLSGIFLKFLLFCLLAYSHSLAGSGEFTSPP